MGLRILLADDEEDIIEVVQDRLEACGFSVTTASNGLEALKKLGLGKFDGVFLDVKMPEMTGIEVLETIRKTDKTLPIIILTSSSWSRRSEPAQSTMLTRRRVKVPGV